MEKVLRKKKYFILFKYQNKKPLQIQTKKERVGGGGVQALTKHSFKDRKEERSKHEREDKVNKTVRICRSK
jgi:hypothetical protein